VRTYRGRIVIVATLDTKDEEVKYIKDLVAQKGHIPTLIDVGVFFRLIFYSSILVIKERQRVLGLQCKKSNKRFRRKKG
jgi:hypothetical protein